MTEIAYTYSDVLIVPKYSEIRSRGAQDPVTGKDLVDLSVQLGHIKLNRPYISANMKDITGAKMAYTISNKGGLGILHRFCTIEDNVTMYKEAQSQTANHIGVSIGVKETEKERFKALYNAGARVFCIDVAHGHHILVREMLAWINNIRKTISNPITVIAGNIATADAYTDLIVWGADVVKVGIGPSPVCRTRYNTGVGVPQLYALEKIYEQSLKERNPIPFIADGGISHVGDIAKALKFADAVMLGSMFAGTTETPGKVFRNENNELYKVFGGSASGENKGENRFVEGVMKTTRFTGHVEYICNEIREGLKSALSYVGANNLQEYKEKCEFVHISNGARMESKI